MGCNLKEDDVMYDGMPWVRSSIASTMEYDAASASTPLREGDVLVADLRTDDTGAPRLEGWCDVDVDVAVSCLVQPCLGDRVRVLVHEGRFFVTDILLRTDALAPLVIGDERKNLELRANDLQLESRGELSLRSSSLSLFSGAAVWVADSLRQVARTLCIEAGNAHRQVEHVDSVSARHVVSTATQSTTLRGRVGSIQADAVLRIDGGQVHMG
jgi:hypothetical protein